MALERIEPYATEHPMKVRDTDTGAVMQASYDSSANAKLDQTIVLLGQLLVAINQVVVALNGIRARLDAGINTKTVTTLATVNI